MDTNERREREEWIERQIAKHPGWTPGRLARLTATVRFNREREELRAGVDMHQVSRPDSVR